MSRPKTLTEEEKKYKQQENQELELVCLQRQYNLLEKDRQLYNCGVSLSRLNNVLDIYQKEHQNILIDLEVATAPAKIRDDAQISKHLTKILVNHDFYEERILKERQYIQEIDAQIKRVVRNVEIFRSRQITDRQHEQRVWAAIKTVEGLMNKLDVQNKKFGTLCAKNKELKLEIERMLWERDMFMKVWRELILKLTFGKKFMMDLIEQATIAYDQREEWCSKLQALRMKAHLDLITQTQNMRELQYKKDNNAKLEEFFYIKGQKRIMRDLEAKNKKKREQQQELLKERLKEYRKFVADIFEFCREKRIEVIAKQFYNKESQNFSLFTQIINAFEELEITTDNLSDLQDKINRQNEFETVRAEQRQQKLENLSTQAENISKEIEESEKKLKSVEKYLNSMLSGISELFKLCKCDEDPILKLLGNNTKITIYNASLYVKMIEEAVLKALMQVYKDEKRDCEKKKIAPNQRMIYDDHYNREVLPFEQMSATTPCPLCIQRQFVSDVIDIPQQVMTIDEVKETLQERLKNPKFAEQLHNVSNCFLPESREVIQKRYQ